MDISKQYNFLWGTWPVRAFRAVVVQSAQPVWQRVIGVSLTEPELKMRALEMPVRKAELGAAAVRAGIEAQDEALRHYGEAMVARALAEADSKPNDLVIQEAVSAVARSLPMQRSTENPYLAAADAGGTEVINSEPVPDMEIESLE